MKNFFTANDFLCRDGIQWFRGAHKVIRIEDAAIIANSALRERVSKYKCMDGSFVYEIDASYFETPDNPENILKDFIDCFEETREGCVQMHNLKKDPPGDRGKYECKFLSVIRRARHFLERK